MKLFRCLMLMALTISHFAASALFAIDEGQETERERDLKEHDYESLREFLETKEDVVLEKKESNLAISGDVRFEWQHLTETEQDIRLRGPGAFNDKGLPISRNDFDVEFNLKFEYKYERAWAYAHLQFDNGAGVGVIDKDCDEDPQGCWGSGDKNRLNLKRAYMGYNIIADKIVRVDIEIGRRKLFDVFDSVIQFDSRMDGIVLKNSKQIEYGGQAYWYIAGFLVDERVNQFAYVTELGVLDICKTGFDLKYSFIDWNFDGRNRCGVRHPRGWQFRNSQFTIEHHSDPCCLHKPLEIYGAFLINHAARARSVTDDKLKNIGWYGGFTIGEVDKQGDWSFDVNYQLVQAQAIPDCDVGGIGRGNICDGSFTENVRCGNTNYKGVRLELLYAITDNFTIDSIFQFSTAEDSNIGGKHRYSCFEIEAIYAF